MSIIDENQRTGRDTGQSTGWTGGDELNPPPPPDRAGPSFAPFLGHRPGDVWWRVGLGFLYIPLIIVVITVQDWLGLPQSIEWVSLGALFVGFIAFVLISDRLTSRD